MAIRWLFEDYLQIPKNKVPKYASCKLFWRLGFSGILTKKTVGLSSSVYGAVNLAWPGEFSKSDFRAHRKVIRMPGLPDFRTKKRA